MLFKVCKNWILNVVFWCLITIGIIFLLRWFYGSLDKKCDQFAAESHLRNVEQQSMGERISRKCLEEIFNTPFPCARPDFLKNHKTGNNLELDCYNEELKIALEYQGIQHYKYTPAFHKSKNDLYKQRYRDTFKKEKCEEHGIILLEVPYWVPYDKIHSHIIKDLGKIGISKTILRDIDVELSKAGFSMVGRTLNNAFGI